MPRPFRMWLYPLPSAIAFLGWAFLFLTSGWKFAGFGLLTLLAGIGAYWIWTRSRMFPKMTRKVARIENDELIVTVTVEGGHIAEIIEKKSGVNPLWAPPWPSIEPSAYSAETASRIRERCGEQTARGNPGAQSLPRYFRSPSEAEYAAGITVHGESSVAPYRSRLSATRMVARAHLPLAQLDFEREIELAANGVVRDSRDGDESNRHGSAAGLDAARHSGTSVSGSGSHDARLERVKVDGVSGGLGDAQRYRPAGIVRLAAGAK